MLRLRKLLLLATGVSLLFGQSGPVAPGVKVDRDLVFSSPGGKDLHLDLYRPEKTSGALPVVVWIFGGAWMMDNQARQAGNASWLATHGYAVAVIGYRLSNQALFPAQINDAKAAVRWLRANAPKYGLDSKRIAAWGESSGGHLATLLGTTGGVATLEGDGGNSKESSRVKAVVDFFGPTDFLKMEGAALPGGMGHNSAESPESRLIGGAIQQNKDKAARANPITYVKKGVPPFLILHGDQDPLVPMNQSELLFAALKQVGANVTFHKIPGAGHGGPAFSTPEVHAMVLAFFDQYLK